jgi:uncharacterized membrane protein
MTTHHFSIREMFALAWGKTKEHAWYLFLVFITYGAFLCLTRNMPFLGSIFDFIIGISLITVSLVIVRGGTPAFNDLIKSFKSYKILWHMVLATILYAIIVIAGLIVFILPGIYLAVRLQFYKFLVVDHETMKPTDALRESMKMTEGIFWKLFAFIIVVILFNMLGALFFLIGLLVTVPITLLATAFLYKHLSAHHAHPTLELL